MRAYHLPLKILKFFLFSLCLILSHQGWALGPIEIQDPDNRLQKLWGFRKPFAQAFQCLKPLPYFLRTGICKVSCEMGMCKDICTGEGSIVETILQAEECEAEDRYIYSAIGGHAIPVTPADYAQSSNSLALSLIPWINSFYDSFEVFKVNTVLYPVSRVLIENGQMRRFAVAVIEGAAFPRKDDFSSVTFQFELDLSADGLAQLMCISTDGDCANPNSSYMIKRKGYFSGY
jgi:hypothetical protein